MAKRSSVVTSAAQELRTLIDSEFEVGEQLPNEKQLAERLDVSRGSVREALGVLESEGRVSRRWGVGTFVAPPRADAALTMTAIMSYRDRIRESGREVELREFSAILAPISDRVAHALGVESDAHVFRVTRLFSVDGVPSALMIEYIPAMLQGVEIDPSMMGGLDCGLFDMLNAHVPGVVAHAITDIEATIPGDAEAVSLELGRGIPVLRTEQLTTGPRDERLAFGVTYQRTDVVRMRIVR